MSSTSSNQHSIRALYDFLIRKNKVGLVSALFLGILFLLCLSAPLWEVVLSIDSSRVQLVQRFDAPNLQNWLGTDDLGRDIFIRLLYAGQISLAVGFAAALAGALLGTVIGLMAGFFGGKLDDFLMRFTDFIISLPLLPLLIVFVALDFEKLGLSLFNDYPLSKIILVIGLVGWPLVARLVRAQARSLREMDFIRAAMALGLSPFRIMLRHILPGTIAPVIVASTLAVGNVILLESALSFLGLGIQPPTPSWGNMLANSETLIWEAPHVMIYPGVMIFLTVLAFNLLGDALQDFWDPKQRRLS